VQPDLERRLELRGRWRAYNTAVAPRPGFELVDAFYPWLFEGYDPGMMELAGEVRYPFLDLRLVRYLLRVPAIPWGAEKCLLRTAMKGVLPVQVLRRPKTPIAGNPFAVMLPPAATAWWERYLVPAPGLEDFVVVAAVRKALADTVPRTQSVNDHGDINALRSSLRPIELNLWLQQVAAPDNLHARESPPFSSPK
jgi:asparagine synthase (glutamine-hydrolysing)